MSTSLTIAIAEPSAIIRGGLETILKRLPGFRLQVVEIASPEMLQETLRTHKPDVLIINPTLPGCYSLFQIKEDANCMDMKCVALLYAAADPFLLRAYDEQISVYDSPEELRHKLNQLVITVGDTDNDEQQTLSTREKEILICVVKGMTSRPVVPLHAYRRHPPAEHHPQAASTQRQRPDGLCHRQQTGGTA